MKQHQNPSHQRTLQRGDRVAYYIHRTISTGHHSSRTIPVRLSGIVQGFRDGQVLVLHQAGYTESLPEAQLYFVE